MLCEEHVCIEIMIIQVMHKNKINMLIKCDSRNIYHIIRLIISTAVYDMFVYVCQIYIFCIM